MDKPEDPTFGTKCFSIAGRLSLQRERCLGMTEEERRWRAQFLKDQILAPDEPRFVPEYYKHTTNCFRRLWKTPMMKLESLLTSTMGTELGIFTRHFIGKGAALIAFIYVWGYYMKYHKNDWTVGRSWEIYNTRKRMYPDHPDYPHYYIKTPQEYFDMGFYSSIFAKK